VAGSSSIDVAHSVRCIYQDPRALSALIHAHHTLAEDTVLGKDSSNAIFEDVCKGMAHLD
jgi:hypothetical protein